MQKITKRWITQLEQAEKAMDAGETVYYMDGKKYVEAHIRKLDPKNRVFTALLHMGKGHLKWVSLDRIAYKVREQMEET